MLAGLIAVGFSIRAKRDNVARKAFEPVRELGGQVTSLPFLWGTEYYIFFPANNGVNDGVNDDTVRNLISLNRITDDHVGLSLCDTKVTDAGLIHLRQMSNLDMLYLDTTYITEEGVADLRHSLPGLVIAYDL